MFEAVEPLLLVVLLVVLRAVVELVVLSVLVLRVVEAVCAGTVLVILSAKVYWFVSCSSVDCCSSKPLRPELFIPLLLK